MTKRSDNLAMPNRALTVAETAEVGRLLCLLYHYCHRREMLELMRVLADAGHGGCQSRMDRILKAERMGKARGNQP
jgi:hypothetical protein